MSEIKPAITQQPLLWIDLEMTGLDPLHDRILEVAAIVTDWEFKEIATFESGVGHDVNEISPLLDANPFYVKMKTNKRQLLELVAESPPEKVVERMLVDFVRENCDTHYPVILAGNSIHMDRQFIRSYWPLLEQLLHYRMLDVSSWKLVFMNKFGQEFKKSEAHRALGDVRESIDELKFYLEKLHADA
jgi:oligoribonuclease